MTALLLISGHVVFSLGLYGLEAAWPVKLMLVGASMFAVGVYREITK